MKWLLAPLVWLVACALAVALLWRVWRGRPVLLRGRWSPRVLRMAAIVVVTLGTAFDRVVRADPPDSREQAESDSRPTQFNAPRLLNEDTVRIWWRSRAAGDPWANLKRAWTQLETGMSVPGVASFDDVKRASNFRSPNLSSVLERQFARFGAQERIPAVASAELNAALDELNNLHYVDSWMAGMLWRETAYSTDSRDHERLPELFGRLDEHIRVSEALMRAESLVRPEPLSRRAWMSKAGPSREMRAKEQATVQQLLDAAKLLYMRPLSGPWHTDATVSLTLARDSARPSLLRGGGRRVIQPGDLIEFNRLDLLESPPGDSPTTFVHDWLGQVGLPPGQLVSVWDLAGLHTPAAAEKLRTVVTDAIRGDDASAVRLERALPFAHSEIRRALEAHPDAPGAPRLRLILTLFDH